MSVKTLVQSKFPVDYDALLAAKPDDFPDWLDGWITQAIAELEFSGESGLSALQEGIVSEKVCLELISSATSLYRKQITEVDADGTKVEFQDKIKTLSSQQRIVEAALERKMRIYIKQQNQVSLTPIIKVT